MASDIVKLAKGRPTSYSDEILEKCTQYLSEFELPQDERSTHRIRNEVVPSIISLCAYIGRGKTTVYNWIADERYTDFRDMCEEIEEMQHDFLINNGLTGKFNSQITKLMLSKHNYSDKAEVDMSSKDGSMKTYSPEQYAMAQTKLPDDLD